MVTASRGLRDRYCRIVAQLAVQQHRVSFGPFLQITPTESITDLVTPWIP